MIESSRNSLTCCSKAIQFEELILSGTGTSLISSGDWTGKDDVMVMVRKPASEHDDKSLKCH